MKPLACLFFLISFSVHGQPLESLKTRLNATTNDKERSELLNKLANHYQEKNLDSVKYYADESFKLFSRTKYLQARGNGLHQMGVFHRKKGEIEKSSLYLDSALEVRKSIGDLKKIGYTVMEIGNLLFGQGEMQENIAISKVSDEEYFAEMKIANGFYGRANKKYLEALNFAKESSDSLIMAKTYQSVANSFYGIAEYDEAIEYYDSSYAFYPLLNRDLRMDAVAGKVTCLLQTERSDSREKIDELLKELRTFFRVKKKPGRWIMINMSLAINAEYSDPNLTIELLEEADSVAKANSNVKYGMKITGHLADIYEKRGDWKKALYYFKRSTDLGNQVSNSDTKSRISELEIKYDTEKTERKFAEERAEKLEEKRMKQQFIWISISIGAALLVLAIVYFQRQRINRLQKKREQEKHNKQINDLLKNQEMASIEAALDGQEQERKRIAEDLHDRLGSTLSAVRMYFESASSSSGENKQERYDKAYKLLDRAIDDTRGIAHNLVAGTLSKFGLFAALEDLKQTIQGAGNVKVEYAFDAREERFRTELEINLYRIVQEVFSNALKHANPRKLSVSITQSESELLVELSDDGKGFDTKADFKGIGLQNIQARIHKLNGEFDLKSEEGLGTIYQIRLNLNEDEKDNYSR